MAAGGVESVEGVEAAAGGLEPDDDDDGVWQEPTVTWQATIARAHKQAGWCMLFLSVGDYSAISRAW